MAGAPTDRTTLVTVGLPVLNGERFVSQAIDALLAQSYRDFILIISDNASTDRTEAICREYARRDGRIRYYRNPRNIGLSANFNRVFGLSRTRYFKWATADDYVSPDMLADAVAFLEANSSVVLCYPRVALVDEISGATQSYVDPLRLMQEDPVERFNTFVETVRLCHHHQGLIRASAIRRTAMLGKHVASDLNFLAELTLYGKFYEIPQIQLVRRFHPESSSWNRSSAAHQARRYHAEGVRRVLFNGWRRHLAFVDGVLRSPCLPRQKARMLVVSGRHMYWAKRELGAELWRDALHGIGWHAGV
jgi:glycosyltransferase involved in cell wall biosynthesis